MLTKTHETRTIFRMHHATDRGKGGGKGGGEGRGKGGGKGGGERGKPFCSPHLGWRMVVWGRGARGLGAGLFCMVAN